MNTLEIKKMEKLNEEFLDLKTQVFQIEKRIQNLKKQKKTLLFLEGSYNPINIEDFYDCVCYEKK